MFEQPQTTTTGVVPYAKEKCVVNWLLGTSDRTNTRPLFSDSQDESAQFQPSTRGRASKTATVSVAETESPATAMEEGDTSTRTTSDPFKNLISRLKKMKDSGNAEEEERNHTEGMNFPVEVKQKNVESSKQTAVGMGRGPICVISAFPKRKQRKPIVASVRTTTTTTTPEVGDTRKRTQGTMPEEVPKDYELIIMGSSKIPRGAAQDIAKSKTAARLPKQQIEAPPKSVEMEAMYKFIHTYDSTEVPKKGGDSVEHPITNDASGKLVSEKVAPITEPEKNKVVVQTEVRDGADKADITSLFPAEVKKEVRIKEEPQPVKKHVRKREVKQQEGAIEEWTKLKPKKV